MNNDTISFKINSSKINDTKIRVTPLIYSNNERINSNYKNKTCPLIFSNYEINDEKTPNLKLIDYANIFFYEKFKNIQFTYEVSEGESDIPIALSLTFLQKSHFRIHINFYENYNIDKNIFNSSNIFFEHELKKGEHINISIEYINFNIPIFMNVKVIKKTSISILEQNNLNYGFITSNIEYQYYFMDIFKDQ